MDDQFFIWLLAGELLILMCGIGGLVNLRRQHGDDVRLNWLMGVGTPLIMLMYGVVLVALRAP